MTERPQHLPQGSTLGEWWTIEGLVRLSEGRMFYLANDLRPDRSTAPCWNCRSFDTSRGSAACVSCARPLSTRRFLVSARWASDRFDATVAWFARGEEHAAVATPVAVFVESGVLYTVIPYAGEGLMVDEASPLSPRRLFAVGQRVLGAVAFLVRAGAALHTLDRANLLLSQDGSVRLFDLDVCGVHEPGHVPAEDRERLLRIVAGMMRRYCDPEAVELLRSLTESELNGTLTDTEAFGRAMEAQHRQWADRSFLPRLGGISDVGLLRQLNEDNWGWLHLSDRLQFYVVADGMGGHDCGEVASSVAVATLTERMRHLTVTATSPGPALEGALRASFQSANNAVKDTAEARSTDMGTTVVCMMVIDGRVGLLANVGDSRGYLLRDGVLDQLTRDHSLVQKLVEKGRIKPEEARHHPHSNILLRTVGTERDVEPEMFRVELQSGDRLLLCSDGLWNEVEDRDLENLMNTYSDPRIAAREMVRAAHHGGGKDNITLVLVEVP
jgi:protein phosphatase